MAAPHDVPPTPHSGAAVDLQPDERCFISPVRIRYAMTMRQGSDRRPRARPVGVVAGAVAGVTRGVVDPAVSVGAGAAQRSTEALRAGLPAGQRRSALVLALIAATTITGNAGAETTRATGPRRRDEGKLMARAALAASAGRFEAALTGLEEVRRVCRRKRARCKSHPRRLLRRIARQCLAHGAACAKLPEVTAKVRAQLPGDTRLLHALEAARAHDRRRGPPREDEGDDDGEAHAPALARAEALLDSRDTEGGIAALRQHLEAHPDDDDARERLIEVLVSEDRRADAIAELGVHITRHPDAWTVRAEQIDLFAQEEREAERAEAIEVMIRGAPRLSLGFALKAEYALDEDDLDGAAEALAQARALGSPDPESSERIADVERALAEAKEKSARSTAREARRDDFHDDLRLREGAD